MSYWPAQAGANPFHGDLQDTFRILRLGGRQRDMIQLPLQFPVAFEPLRLLLQDIGEQLAVQSAELGGQGREQTRNEPRRADQKIQKLLPR